MAGHRSPHGTRARRTSEIPYGASARHRTAQRPPAQGPSLRNTVVASAAAVGAVATGTFTALVPGDPHTSADAAESFDGTLASTSALLAALPADALPTGGLAPVAFTPVGFEQADGVAIADSHLAQLDKAAVLAAEAAERLAAEQRIAAERARLDAVIAEGGLDGWIAEALDILDLPQSLAGGVEDIVMAESGGNPRAINNWDSNARAGTPSQGLMQTIPSTFRAYVHPEVADRGITDPVANITAGVRYMIDRYGVDTLEAGGRTNSSGSYVGY